jgi:hypothetical protein
MEAVRTSETSANLHHTTRQNILENSYFYIRRRENLKPREDKPPSGVVICGPSRLTVHKSLQDEFKTKSGMLYPNYTLLWAYFS